MLKRNALMAALLGLGLLVSGAMGAQQKGSSATAKAITLTPLDYIEIRQLVNRYTLRRRHRQQQRFRLRRSLRGRRRVHAPLRERPRAVGRARPRSPPRLHEHRALHHEPRHRADARRRSRQGVPDRVELGLDRSGDQSRPGRPGRVRQAPGARRAERSGAGRAEGPGRGRGARSAGTRSAARPASWPGPAGTTRMSTSRRRTAGASRNVISFPSKSGVDAAPLAAAAHRRRCRPRRPRHSPQRRPPTSFPRPGSRR